MNTIGKIMALADELQFCAVEKSRASVGLDYTVAYKKWNIAREALRAAITEALDIGEPVAWHVVDEKGQLMHAAAWKEAAHEHINDAINEFDLVEAKNWTVNPVYSAKDAK